MRIDALRIAAPREGKTKKITSYPALNFNEDDVKTKFRLRD